MSQSIKNLPIKPCTEQAGSDAARQAMATLEKYFAGTKILDLQKVAKEHATLVAAIDYREYMRADVERKHLRAKHRAQDHFVQMTRALKALASGGA